jgi:uncharacterized membrane protein YdjX (TVP38/TMEM64 family)
MINQDELVQSEQPVASASLWQQHWQKGVALTFWAALLGSYFWYVNTHEIGLADLLGRVRSGLFGPLLYILLFLVRPLIFFPASILTIAGGLLFGAVGGVSYTFIAGNLSALVAYIVGRYFGRGMLEGGDSTRLVHRYAMRMRKNSFETVLIMRFLWLPYDFVNYLSGFLRINWKAFLLATAIGGFPATVSLVLIGVAGDLDELAAGKISLNPWALAASVLLLGASLAVSYYLRRREGR